MVSILIAISFILHLLAFFWIILLSIRVNKSKEINAKQVEVQKEIEDMFQAYLLEMKEENEKLLHIIEESGKTNKVKPLAQTATSEPINDMQTSYKPSPLLQGKIAKQTYQSQKPQQRASLTNEKPNNYVPPVPVGEEQFEQSFTSQVFRLNADGLSAGEIARKLNRGKTEIELLLKFREQSK
ncbi:hypothetical protein [Calidifontibacillus oryziterrae]|uniref:hypothetical protein n=1 Tax=Calidifontibacillus oryziterrae TaxID=1191699 RepID=UPI0002F4DB1A|nr:hypothetical protein [Calidifontibacillus oryziterrae]